MIKKNGKIGSDQGFSDQVIKKYIKVGRSNWTGEHSMFKNEAITGFKISGGGRETFS